MGIYTSAPKTPEEIAAWRVECRIRLARGQKTREGFRELHESGWAPWDGYCRVWTCGDDVRIVTWADDGSMTWVAGTKEDKAETQS